MSVVSVREDTTALDDALRGRVAAESAARAAVVVTGSYFQAAVGSAGLFRLAEPVVASYGWT